MVVSASAMLSCVTLPSVVFGLVVVVTSFLVVTSKVDTVVVAAVERVVTGNGVSVVISVVSEEKVEQNTYMYSENDENGSFPYLLLLPNFLRHFEQY